MPCMKGVRLPVLPTLEPHTKGDKCGNTSKSKAVTPANKVGGKAPPRRRAKRMRKMSVASCSRKRMAKSLPDSPLSAIESVADVIKFYMCSFMYPEAIVALGVTSKRLYLFMQNQRLWHMLSKRVWHLRCPPGCMRDHNWRVAYRARMRSFRQGKIHLCPFCTCRAGYVHRLRLLRHLSGHEVDTRTGKERRLRFECPVDSCRQLFEYRSKLKAHVLKEHKVSPENYDAWCTCLAIVNKRR